MKEGKKEETGALQNGQFSILLLSYRDQCPPVMNNTPHTISCVACLWVWAHNYWVLTFPLPFGMQKYQDNSCEVCTHRRACYSNSVSFFLVWTALKVNSNTSVQSNYWKLENVQDDVKYKQPFERKRASWSWRRLSCPVNQMCFPASFSHCKHLLPLIFLFVSEMLQCHTVTIQISVFDGVGSSSPRSQ